MNTISRMINQRRIKSVFQSKRLSQFLHPLIAAAFLLVPGQAAQADKSFVLVHGAFVGAWYWDPVASGLRQKGHRVVAVDLTGHGTRAGENGPDVTIDQHISDVVAAIESADTPVILVAHSYGGRPATGAWDVARDRIEAVIFIEAAAPYGSGPLALPDEKGQRAKMMQLDPEAIAAGLLQPPPQLQQRYPGKPIAPQSLRALYAAVPLTNGPLPDTPGAFVLGAQSDARIFRQYAGRVAEQRGWTVWEIESGHDVVADAGETLTRLLDKLAQELPTGN